MVFEQTAFVGDLESSIIQTYSPCILTLDSSRIASDVRFFKIVYDWGDGNTSTVNYKPILGTDDNLSISDDIGDTRNYPQTNIFYLKSPEPKDFKITVSLYSSLDVVVTYNLVLSLSASPVDQNIHLLKTKMFDLDNKILYTFETESPKNILMSLVNWKSKPVETTINALNRDYKILPPFLKKINNNPNIR